MTKRVTYRLKPSYIVECRDCDWEYEGANAVGLAAQHCDRHGHTVHVDSFGGVTFTPEGSDYDKAQKNTGNKY